jgi:hypothetical protein
MGGQKKSKAATIAALKRLATERAAHLAIHQEKSHSVQATLSLEIAVVPCSLGGAIT